MLPTSYDRQAESNYCCIQPCSTITRRWYCIALFSFNACSILNFVFELTINLLYHLQLHMHACAALQWLHAECSSSACVIVHAQIIYGLVLVWRECNFSYVKGPMMSFLVWWRHFWSDDVNPWQLRSTPLDYEQCGARTWARISRGCSHSPKKCIGCCFDKKYFLHYW